MAAYTIEDVELIRAKSGISYQEALSLLEYHNGNVARALVDLERNGRIKPDAQQSRPASSTTSSSGHMSRNGLLNLLSKLYRARLHIRKGETTVVNLSALFSIFLLIFAPHMLIIGAIVSLVLGYKFSFTGNDPAFQGENLERMVKNAAENVRASVSDFARGFQDGAGTSGNVASGTTAQSASADGDSFYAAGSPAASASYRASVPTMNVPVQVESQDGSVTVEGDAEGFTSATIE